MILQKAQTVDVAQLVRATDCGSVGRGFEPHLLPSLNQLPILDSSVPVRSEESSFISIYLPYNNKGRQVGNHRYLATTFF